jgi:transposase
MPPELQRVVLLSLLNRQAAQQQGPRRWTLRGLQRWIESRWGLCYSTETLRRTLLRLGFSWKKARKLLARANTLTRFLFLQRLQGLLTAAEQGEVVLAFIDEAHIHCDVDLGYVWGLRGLPLLVHSTTPGLSYKSSFYGIYLFPLGRVEIWPATQADTDQTCQMLSRLRQDYPDQKLVILWDGASYHRSTVVCEHADKLGITLVPLPGYSPDLMPVEPLWRWLRQEVTGNYCHSSVAELLQRVASFAWNINLQPDLVAARLALKTCLDPTEEELRISNWF